MAEINKLKKEIDKNAEISRASHFQTKGRLSKLEKEYSILVDKITGIEEEKLDIKEIKEEIDNVKRGLANLWSSFKEFRSNYDKAS